MYDRLELFEAHNKFWQLVHDQIDQSPKILSRYISLWDLWLSVKITFGRFDHCIASTFLPKVSWNRKQRIA